MDYPLGLHSLLSNGHNLMSALRVVWGKLGNGSFWHTVVDPVDNVRKPAHCRTSHLNFLEFWGFLRACHQTIMLTHVTVNLFKFWVFHPFPSKDQHLNLRTLRHLPGRCKGQPDYSQIQKKATPVRRGNMTFQPDITRQYLLKAAL